MDHTLALSVESVTVRFGGFTALDSVSVSVPAGKVIGIVGPNGAGKSTLVDVTSGFIQPASGAVTLAGRQLSGERASTRAKLGLVRTFQTPRLFDSLTVIQHFSVLQGRHWDDRLASGPYTRDLLARLDLIERADERAEALAGGQRKLLDVARAFAQQAVVTILDEPVAGVARHHHDAVAAIVHEVVRDGTRSVVVVEHNLAFVETVCDSVVVLDFGRVIATGLWSDIKTRQRVVEAYLGRDDVRPIHQVHVKRS